MFRSVHNVLHYHWLTKLMGGSISETQKMYRYSVTSMSVISPCILWVTEVSKMLIFLKRMLFQSSGNAAIKCWTLAGRLERDLTHWLSSSNRRSLCEGSGLHSGHSNGTMVFLATLSLQIWSLALSFRNTRCCWIIGTSCCVRTRPLYWSVFKVLLIET